MGFYQFKKKLFIQSTIEEVWDFISSPENLKEITPDYMGFVNTTKNLPGKMYPGMIISYKINPFSWFQVTWVTEITQVIDKKFFIDEQRIGPYSFWHHQHFIEEYNGGVIMTDIVSYKPPFGILGNILNTLFIRKKLEAIFNFRSEAICKRYP